MARRQLKGFLYSIGIDAMEYPLSSELKTSFIDGENNSITNCFFPYDYLLTEESIKDFIEFINSVERDLRIGNDVTINIIQISENSVTINPGTPYSRLFMRDV